MGAVDGRAIGGLVPPCGAEPAAIRCSARGHPISKIDNSTIDNCCLQLRCGGVLEAVRISCAGYPTKMPFFDFSEHFWMLGLDSAQLEDRDFAKLILCRVLGQEGWQLGKTKVGGGRGQL